MPPPEEKNSERTKDKAAVQLEATSDPNFNSDDGYMLRHSNPSKPDKEVKYSDGS